MNYIGDIQYTSTRLLSKCTFFKLKNIHIEDTVTWPSSKLYYMYMYIVDVYDINANAYTSVDLGNQRSTLKSSYISISSIF